MRNSGRRAAAVRRGSLRAYAFFSRSLVPIPFTAATSLTVIKPVLRSWIQPIKHALWRSGVKANQITLISILGSLFVGTALAMHAHQPHVFLLIPVWLAIRASLAAIDGGLALDFGQKSLTGGLLNEWGDIFSDVALTAAWLFVAPFSAWGVASSVVLIVASELSGMCAEQWGAGRGVEGPFGKTDRAIAFGSIGLWYSAFGELPQLAEMLMPLFMVLSLVTMVNRLGYANVRLRSLGTRQVDKGARS